MDKLWELLDTLLHPVLTLVANLTEPVLEQLAPLGLTEPVIKFMLISAILGVSIYLTLYCGMFSLANAGFMAIGGYVGAILTAHHDARFGESLFYSMLAAGLVAILIGLPVLRLKNIYLAIATIGFGEIVRLMILNFDEIAVDLRDSHLFSSIARPILRTMVDDIDQPRLTITFGPRGITRIPVVTEIPHLIVFLILVSYFLYRLHHSRMGRAMAAIRQDERVAAGQGIDVVYYKNVAFFMGAILAGAAGNFNAHTIGVVEPSDFGFNRAVDILAYAVLGGLGNWFGPILGGLTLTAIPELLRELKAYTGLISGVLLLLIIVYLPNGLTSLLWPTFWTEGGRFVTAKRIATAGIITVALVNVLPYRSLATAEGRILGYEFWGLLLGNIPVALVFAWIRAIRPRASGGYFSLPLTLVAGVSLLIFILLGLLGTIQDLSSGYFVHLIGMAIIAGGGLLTYPASDLQPIRSPVTVQQKPLQSGSN